MDIASAIVLLALTVLSPWLAEESRPVFEERSESERFGVLR